MRRLIIAVIVALWPLGGTVCMAQEQELQLTYQRIQSFTFRSGAQNLFEIDGAALNGGGYTYVINITEKFGLFQQMGFFSGVEQNGLKMRLLTEHQGVRIKTEKGPFTLYAKGGVGVARDVFEGLFQGVDYHMAFTYGVGTEFRIPGGLYMVIDASRHTMSLPNFFPGLDLPDRTGWSNAWHLSTGVVFRFGG